MRFPRHPLPHRTSLALFLLASLLIVLRADAQLDWTWRNPRPQGNFVNGAGYGGGRFVAVGNTGSIVTSPDGATWSAVPPPSASDLYEVVYGNGVYVAVGSDGAILRSTDGTAWSLCNSGSVADLKAVTYAGGLFVAGGGSSSRSGEILTSPDGVAWTRRKAGLDQDVEGLAYGNGVYVGVGSNYLRVTSADGITWTAQATSSSDHYFAAIAFGKGLFVGACAFGELYTSPDGVIWTQRTSPTTANLLGVNFTGTSFVAVGANGTLLTSPDGITWSVQTLLGYSQSLSAVTSGNGVCLTGGYHGTLLTSTDLVRWTFRSGLPPPASVAYFKNHYFGVSYASPSAGYGALFDSADGVTWSVQKFARNLSRLVVGNNLLVGVGNLGGIMTTPDGVTWTSHSVSSSTDFADIAYGAGVYVATDDQFGVRTSTNGTTWTLRNTGQYGQSPGVAYGNGLFVIVGQLNGSPIITTSPTGTTWTARSSGQSQPLTDVAFGNGQFVAVGTNGAVITSPDGVTWTPRPAPANVTLSAIGFGGGRFAAGALGQLFSSADGITWGSQATGSHDDFDEISYANSTFFALSDSILTSSNGTTWTRQSAIPPDAWVSVTFGQNLFAAATNWSGSYLGGSILTSPDGVNWTGRCRLPDDGTGIGSANGLFLAGTFYGKLLTSPDGLTWTPQTSGTSNALNAFAWGNGTYVAAGGAYSMSTILTSPDAVTWTAQTPANAGPLNGIVYASGLFVAAGGSNNSGAILTSPDGTAWTARTAPGGEPLRGIAYGSGLFVAVGDYGVIVTSPDGVTWTLRRAASDDFLDELGRVLFRDGTFVALEWYNGGLLTSIDGANWTRQAGRVARKAYGIAYGNGTFSVVGEDSNLLTAPDLATPLSLSASPKSTQQIDLAWLDVAGETGYAVERRTGAGGAWTVLAPALPANTTSYSDTQGQVATSYSYRVRSLQAGAGSPYSNLATAGTYSLAQQWRSAQFGTANNTGSAADDADPDGDGMKNLAERAFGTNPNDPRSNAGPSVSMTADHRLTVQFVRDAQLTDLRYRVQVSGDLSSWTPVAESTAGAATANLAADSVTEENLGGTRYRVTVTVAPTAPEVFGRVDLLAN